MNRDPFEEYIKETEPGKRYKAYAWHTAIGLQAVDGLKTSEYLTQTAIRNIEGEISFDEANALLQTYYEENPSHNEGDRTEEADKVSARISALLSERAFSFTPNEYLSIHRKLFIGIYSHAGHIRDYNITKKEWVLGGATVLYGSASELRATLEYDFSEEKNFSYRNLSMDEIIHHLALFVSKLWQKHPLHSRTMHISGTFAESEKADIGVKKSDIESEKVDIEDKKSDIESLKSYIEASFQPKTANHIIRLLDEFFDQPFFGRSDVMDVLDIKPSRASDLLKAMTEHEIIEPVSGHGKGKYRLVQTPRQGM